MSHERKQVPLRLDPAVHEALSRWAADELRSLNAQIEMVLRRGLSEAGRMPANAQPVRPRGRPGAATAERPPKARSRAATRSAQDRLRANDDHREDNDRPEDDPPSLFEPDAAVHVHSSHLRR